MTKWNYHTVPARVGKNKEQWAYGVARSDGTHSEIMYEKFDGGRVEEWSSALPGDGWRIAEFTEQNAREFCQYYNSTGAPSQGVSMNSMSYHLCTVCDEPFRSFELPFPSRDAAVMAYLALLASPEVSAVRVHVGSAVGDCIKRWSRRCGEMPADDDIYDDGKIPRSYR